MFDCPPLWSPLCEGGRLVVHPLCEGGRLEFELAAVFVV